MPYKKHTLLRYQEFDLEATDVSRKKSLVKHNRAKIDKHHPNYHYTQVANQELGHLKILPSSTGLNPALAADSPHHLPSASHDSSLRILPSRALPNRASPSRVPLAPASPSRSSPARDSPTRPDTRLLAEDDTNDAIPLVDLPSKSAVSPSPGPSLPKPREYTGLNDEHDTTYRSSPPRKPLLAGNYSSQPSHKAAVESRIYPWKVYCYLITFWAPGPLLRLFGLSTKDRQFAWREKIGLISCVFYVGAFVAYITFGFTRTVCSDRTIRVRNNFVSSGYMIINGDAYDLTSSQHPAAAGITNGANVLYPPVNGGGMDASFLFQNVNGNCKGLIKPRDNCSIPFDGDNLAWYMPCQLFAQNGTTEPNYTTNFYPGWACHTSPSARSALYSLKPAAEVYFEWTDIRNSSRNLVVYNGAVMDLDLINWLSTDDVTYPTFFDQLRDDPLFKGHDVSLVLTKAEERHMARCLTEIIKVGVVDYESVGCIASKVLLIVSLVFILLVVVAKFIMACYYRWFLSRRQGATVVDNKSMAARNKEIEDWVNDSSNAIGGQVKTVPLKARANYKPQKTNRQSVFMRAERGLTTAIPPPQQDLAGYYETEGLMSKSFSATTMTTQAAAMNRLATTRSGGLAAKPIRLSTMFASDGLLPAIDLLSRPASQYNPFDRLDESVPIDGLSSDIIHPDVVPQPPVEYQPFGYPLAHVMTLVTCYSEDELGLRTTLDSLATTDYPSSHKLIVIICDGIIKGSGNDMTTPDIALAMISDFTVPPQDVVAHSYVAVAQGSKRHNMAKVYAGFYKYNDETVPVEKQQRVPVVCVVKCGTPAEESTGKPGNRGKRDSQIILMSFLQKVMFDERMTDMEFELLNSIWRITGMMAEFYEMVLMVDADTKVFPDSVTHMAAEMVRDPAIMGLCGETKISNKSQTWVTAIQVFEYYISHHQAKAFESVFGGVTCLPGCFSMYRIKAPKGDDGYWVPILANPDIVERYSDNNVKTLHRKNLLLLGEDRYLTSLMLRTFPKRKQVFVSKAACKTVVPDNFKVLLSQRRRWINSTVHNLMELVLVKDLCGTFCFSMQFVVFVELIGTAVLPIAICLTIYVIIFSIYSKPTPVLSLALLGLVFGLPGLMIVVTVSSWTYIVYFFIYLLALPIWNFVLPTYAFWKFDDFSWGETRLTADGNKPHDTEGGEFDSTNIYMKRWREFERDRRNMEDASREAAYAAHFGGDEDAASALEMPRAIWNRSGNA